MKLDEIIQTAVDLEPIKMESDKEPENKVG